MDAQSPTWQALWLYCWSSFQVSAFFSVFGGLFMAYSYDGAAISKDGFFQGYNSVIWVVVLLQVVSFQTLADISTIFKPLGLRGVGNRLGRKVCRQHPQRFCRFFIHHSVKLHLVVDIGWLRAFVVNTFPIPSFSHCKFRAFSLGAMIVVGSTFLYGYEPSKQTGIHTT